MKLYLKLFSLIFIGIILIFALTGILQVRRETKFFREEILNDTMALGRILANEISNAWENGGMSRVNELLRKANDADANIQCRWVGAAAMPDHADPPDGGSARMAPSGGNAVRLLEKPDASGEMRALYYFPVTLPDGRHGGLELSQSLSGLKQYTGDTLKYYIVMSVILILAVGSLLAMGSFWLLAKPLHLVIQRTREINSGKLDGRLQIHRRDEIGELALSINDMSEQLLRNREKIRREMQARINALEQLRHEDRLRSVGRLASGVAHELGTPLNVISGRAGLIATDASASREIAGSAETIRGQCKRMTKIIRQLLDFARRSTPESAPVDLNRIIAQTAVLLKPLAKKKRVKFDFHAAADPAIVVADIAQLEQVLTNLLTNAVQAMPDGGRVRIAVEKTRAIPPEQDQQKENLYHVVRVRDEGSGISPEDLPHIFDPFYTTKDTGEGTGLGLSIAHGIVQEHGGWISATSEPGHGSTFSVFLPAEDLQ